jgi:hypothetical protein
MRRCAELTHPTPSNSPTTRADCFDIDALQLSQPHGFAVRCNRWHPRPRILCRLPPLPRPLRHHHPPFLRLPGSTCLAQRKEAPLRHDTILQGRAGFLDGRLVQRPLRLCANLDALLRPGTGLTDGQDCWWYESWDCHGVKELYSIYKWNLAQGCLVILGAQLGRNRRTRDMCICLHTDSHKTKSSEFSKLNPEMKGKIQTKKS